AGVSIGIDGIGGSAIGARIEFDGNRRAGENVTTRRLVKGRAEQIYHQADGGLRGSAAGVAIGVYLDDIEAYELSFLRNSLHQLINFSEAEAARLEGSSSWRERGIHGVDVESD